MAFTLSSSSFNSGAEIPKQYTCKDEDISPALTWSGAPQGTGALALIVDDPDAPAGTWVHWLLWNVPSSSHALEEGIARNEELPDGSRQGRNDFRKIGYNGPCPPAGKPHHYFFRLYALDTMLQVPAGASRQELDGAMKGHILAQAEYMGKFKR